MKYNKVLLISFMLIVVVSVAAHVFLIENRDHIKYDGYGLSFLCMFFVGLLGYTAWRKYPIKWPSRIWGIVYTGAFCILACLRLVDKFIFHLPTSYIANVRHIRDIFDSPMPFFILYVLVKNIAKATPVQTRQQPL